jgi:hypothetical protein
METCMARLSHLKRISLRSVLWQEFLWPLSTAQGEFGSSKVCHRHPVGIDVEHHLTLASLEPMRLCVARLGEMHKHVHKSLYR